MTTTDQYWVPFDKTHSHLALHSFSQLFLATAHTWWLCVLRYISKNGSAGKYFYQSLHDHQHNYVQTKIRQHLLLAISNEDRCMHFGHEGCNCGSCTRDARWIFHQQKPVMIMVCSLIASVWLFYWFNVHVTGLYRFSWARQWSQWSLHCCVALAGVRNNENASVLSWQTIAIEWWGSSNMLHSCSSCSNTSMDQLSKQSLYTRWLIKDLVIPSAKQLVTNYRARSVTPAWVSYHHATAARYGTTSNDVNAVELWHFTCHHFRWTSLHWTDVLVHFQLIVCC